MNLPKGIDFIYRFTPDGQLTYLNPLALSTLGLTEEELVGHYYYEFIRPDYRDRVVEFYWRQFRSGQSSTYYEFPFVAQGVEIWIGQTIELIMEEGRIKEVLGIARPINELRQAKEDLQKTDQHLLTLLQHLDAAILIENEEAKVQYVNQHFCDYFQLLANPEDIIDAHSDEVCRQISPLFLAEEEFQANWKRIVTVQQIIRGQRIELSDGRVMDRDYIPLLRNGSYQGHMWVYRDVTMRHLTEQALKESEMKYREIIENIDLGLMEVEPDETIVWANEPFLKTTGHTLESLKGRNAQEVFLNDEDRAFHKKILEETQNLRDQGETSAYELPVRNADGEQLWMLISGAPIKDISGQVVGSLGIHHNVTPQKDLQKLLEYRLNLQSVLLDLANALILFEPEKEAQVIQEALAKMGRFVKADRVYIFDYHLDRQSTSNTYEWCAEGIEPEIENLQEVPLEAIPMWYETHAAGKPMTYDDVAALEEGNAVREILEPQGIQSIITVPILVNDRLHGFIGLDAVKERKQWTEEESELLAFMAQMLAAHYLRREVQTKLSESEFRMRSVLENALDAVITINSDGLIENWNLQAEEIFKYTSEEALGKSLAGMIIPEKFAAAHDRGIKHYLETGEGPVLNQRIELVAHDKDGRHFPVELSIIPFMMGDQHYFSSFLRDITSRKQAEEDMNLALEQQKELAKMKSRLISMASHEFRTPLTTIKANAEMLEIWTQRLPEEHQAKAMKYLNRLNSETNRLSNIMTDILVLGRLESGKIDVKLRNLELVNHIKDVVDRDWSNQPDGREIGFKLTGGPRMVQIDTEMLDHILQNLIGNAFKYSPGAEPPLLHLNYEKDYMRLSVIDYGIGVPLEDQDKIFESFFRSENTRGIQGSGMGLAVVQQMCTMLGLNLRFFSEPGKGSEFVIDIPLTN